VSSKVPRIVTARTEITVPTAADGGALRAFVVANRERLARWEPLRDDSYFTVDACRERAADAWLQFERGNAIHLLAWDLASSRILAQCSFTHLIRGVFDACFLGFAVDGESEGSGIMHEVLEAAIGYMFDEVALHRIMANYMPANLRSERLLTRLGFEREGYGRSYLKIAGRWEDHILTSRLNPSS